MALGGWRRRGWHNTRHGFRREFARGGALELGNALSPGPNQCLERHRVRCRRHTEGFGLPFASWRLPEPAWRAAARPEPALAQL